MIGSEGSSGGNPIIYVGPDQTREMRVLVTTHQQLERRRVDPADLHHRARVEGGVGGECGRSLHGTVRKYMMSDFTQDETQDRPAAAALDRMDGSVLLCLAFSASSSPSTA